MFRPWTLLAAASSALLLACPPPPVARAPIPSPVEVPFPGETKEEVRRYLRALAERIEPAWRQTIAMAASLLPAKDPANQLDRVTEIEVQLDWNGQPTSVRISRPSGHAPYDTSALRAISDLGVLPPLPAGLGERRATLYWRFHRDGRGASPGAARLETREVSAHDLLTRALRRGLYDRAAEILGKNGPRPELLSPIAEAGLASKRVELRRLALPLASGPQLRALLDREPDPQSWNAALEALVAAREGAEIAELVEVVVKVGAAADATRAAAVLRALARVGRSLPAATAKRLLAHSDAAIALAAVEATSSTALLDEALAREAKRPGRAGPLAVRRCQLERSSVCETAIREALTSALPAPTLEALTRTGLTGFDAELEAIARSGKANARPLALALSARRGAEPKLFYLGLRGAEVEVQLAALHGMLSAKIKRPALVRRLTDLVGTAQGRLLAEALAALARLGDEGARREVLRRMKRLDAAGTATVAAALDGYGEAAVAPLAALLLHASREVREAAAASLRRIPGEKAKAALASLPAPPAPPAGSLESLLRAALALRGASPR